MSFYRSAGLITIAIFVVYGRSLGFEFVWDVYHFLVDNESIKSLGNIPSFFFEPADDLYRPLRTVLYALTYAVFGLDPFFYHLIGILFHLAASLLVLRILLLFGFSKNPAFFGALIFALHPIHIEKFVLSTAAFDMPGDILLLSAFYFYLKYRRGEMRHGLKASLAVFGAGLFFNEIVATFPFLCLLVEFLPVRLEKFSRRQKVSFALSVFAILAVYIFIRTGVLGRIQRPGEAIPYLQLQLSMMAVYLHYWRLLVFPYPLSPVAPFEVFGNAFCQICILASVLNSALLIAAWRARKSYPYIAIGIFWFYLAILPNSNIIPTGTLMAERYLYIPSMGLSILAAYWFTVAGKFGKPVALAVIAFLVLLSSIQTGQWKNGETLWKSAIHLHPDKRLGWHNLGAYYRRENKPDEAIAVYKKMIVKGIEPVVALSELAAYAIDRGDFLLAEKILFPISRVNMDDKGITGNLLIALCQQNRPGWQERAGRVLKKFPSAFLYEQAGNCYAKINDKDEAMKLFISALKINPDNDSVKSKINLLDNL